MGVRTVEQLVESLDSDLAWRKLELATWSSVVARSRDKQRDAILRGAWALLYAHWEGYVKNSCTTYLEYVDAQGLRLGDLRDSLAAIALRPTITAAAASTHGSAHTQLVAAVRAANLKANMPHDRATIKTNSNLSFDTFLEILWSIGGDPVPFADMEDFLDSELLRFRNDIAHGRYMLVDQGRWEVLRGRLVDAMNELRAQIENAAMLQSFRHTAA